ncbi:MULTISPECIES: hypothetical protein [Nocardiopsis]|uniref:hypothetical protein n=1 Tax=Nocardiopsis TaxID=2013 RepID=UPI001D036B2C|nr:MULTISPECIES: hypothetical protein [Nocardiopsis]
MSHTKIHDTLIKPTLPTKGAVEMIAEVLAEAIRGANVDAEVHRLLELWDAASPFSPAPVGTEIRHDSEADGPRAVEPLHPEQKFSASVAFPDNRKQDASHVSDHIDFRNSTFVGPVVGTVKNTQDFEIRREQRHDDLGPPHPGEIQTTTEPSRAAGQDLFGSITVPRDYRVAATAHTGNSQCSLPLPLVLHAHVPHRFHIEHLPPGASGPRTQEVRFRFWPPIAGVDDANAWRCPCDRPTGETTEGQGHWEMRVPINHSRPPNLH